MRINFFLRIILFIGFFSISSTAFSSHIAGGEITYECLGGNQYRIKYVFFRDCNGISLPSSVTIDIYDVNDNLIQSPSLPLIDTTLLNGASPSPCTIVPNVCLLIGEYEVIVTLPPIPGGYQMTFDACCRNGGIVNGPAGSAAYSTWVPDIAVATCNNSATFNGWPPVFICLADTFTFDHSATDLDGDSLVYSLCTPYESIIPNTPYPFGGAYSAANPLGGNTLTIDPVTGLLSGIPMTLGRHVVGICVSEYRNGVLINTSTRDFQLNVVQCEDVTVASSISALTNCLTGEVTFFNNSSGAASYFWDFGDGNTSTDASPIHSYFPYGTYTVSLIAYNAGNPSCNDTVSLLAVADTCNPCGMTASVTTTDGICNAVDGCVQVTWVHPCSSTQSIVYGGVSISGGCGSSTNISTGSAPNYGNIIATVDGVQLPSPATTETIVLLGPASPCSGTIVTSSGGGNITYTFNAVYTTPQTGQAIVNITGGTPPYTIQWTTTPTQLGDTAFAVDPGSYSVIVTDANSCVTVESFVIAGASSMILTPSATDVTACGANDGTLNVGVSGNTGTPTYLWTPGGYTTANVTNVPPGTYSVMVTDDSCSASGTVTILDAANVIVTANLTDITCPTDSDGSATIASISGGLGPYTYSWNSTPVQTGNSATNLPFGFYTVTATDQNGCTGTYSFGITGPVAMSDSIGMTPASCAETEDGTASVVVTGGTPNYTYSWNSSPTQTGSTATGLEGHILYTVTITDDNGCILTDSIEVEAPEHIHVDLYDISTITCAGVFTGAAFADVSGGAPDVYNVTSLYNEGFGTDDLEIDCPNWHLDVSGGGTSTIMDPLDYFRVINNEFAGQDLDGEGVWYTEIVDISAEANVNLSGDFYECGGMEAGDYVRAYYSINGGPEIQWFDQTDDSGVNCSLLPGAAPGLSGNTIQIIVRMFNGSGEIHKFDNINITGNVSGVLYNEPFNTNDLWNDPDCHWWRDVSSVVTTDISGAGTADHVETRGGVLEFRDVDGEIVWYSAVVDISSCVSSSISADFDYSGFMSGTEYIRGYYSLDGGPEVLWVDHTDDNAAGWPTGNPSTDVINGLTGNTLQFIVRVYNTGSSDIHTLDNVIIGCTSINPNPYSYAWTCTGATTDTVTALPAGFCTVTVSDSLGCSEDGIIEIINPGVISATATATSACGGTNNGTATALGTGGNLPYTYSWDCSGATTQALAGLSAGTNCTVTITDGDGCTDIALVNIVADPAVSADTISVTPSCLNSGAIDLAVFGGTPGFIYFWSNGDTIQDISNLPGPSVYTVSVWDNNNCYDTLTVFVDSTCSVLPITLVNFNVICDNEARTLYWSTLSETNNDFFTIERSTTGVEFESIGTVSGAGNSSSPINYSFLDIDRFNQTTYYRLKQIDYDGEYSYSSTRVANCVADDVSIYPNPFNTTFRVNIKSGISVPIRIKVLDNTGRIVYNRSINVKSKNVDISIGEELSPGAYQVIVDLGTQIYVERIVKVQ
ncbi:MAG: PKD domain-containing protein [Crocinitomicaceae bacterium]|nr:PKD domain-containing protein [Crocinitomicaceae bacterium]